MKLRNFFLAAAAFAGVFALAFTSCDKDDDKVTNVDAIGLWKLSVDSTLMGSSGMDDIYFDIHSDLLGLGYVPDAETAKKYGVSTDTIYCSGKAKVISIEANTDSAVVKFVGGSDTISIAINRVNKNNYTMSLRNLFAKDTTLATTRVNMPVSYRLAEE